MRTKEENVGKLGDTYIIYIKSSLWYLYFMISFFSIPLVSKILILIYKFIYFYFEKDKSLGSCDSKRKSWLTPI